MSDTEVPTPSEPRSTVWSWWNELQIKDRAGRAELRRCGTSAEVAFTAPYHRLLRRLGSKLGVGDDRRVAMLAGVLAHVEVDTTESVARSMGTPREGAGMARVSDVRFRQILRNDNVDELFRDLVRVLRQLGREASVDRLFQDLMRWTEATRMRWARDYYEAAPPPKSHDA